MFIVLNVVAIVIPSSYTSAFWVGYIFTLIAYGLCIYSWYGFFEKKEKLFSKVLNIPIINVASIYVVIQFIALLVFKFVPTIPTWISVVICVIGLALSLVFMITLDGAEEYIEKIDSKVAIKVYFMKSLLVDVEMISEKLNDKKVKEKVEKLAEKIRFSDPMSNEMLNDLDEKISSKIEIMKESNEQELIRLADEVELLIIERNKKCKILK